MSDLDENENEINENETGAPEDRDGEPDGAQFTPDGGDALPEERPRKKHRKRKKHRGAREKADPVGKEASLSDENEDDGNDSDVGNDGNDNDNGGDNGDGGNGGNNDNDNDNDNDGDDGGDDGNDDDDDDDGNDDDDDDDDDDGDDGKKHSPSDREKIKLEKQLVKEGKILPRGHYMPKGRVRGILACCLAFFFGFFISFGALFGVISYFANIKVKNALQLILSDDAAMKPEDYIAEEYLDGTIFDLIGAITSEFDDMTPANLTLDKFAKYSPYLKSFAQELKNQVAVFGVDLNIDEIFATPFSSYGTYLQDNVMKKVELGKALDLKGDSDPLLLALCYGENGVDYTVDGENNIVPSPNATLKPLTLGDVIGGTDAGESGEGGDQGGEAATNGLLNRARTIRLGTVLGYGTNTDLDKIADNAALYTICYGDYKTDYELDQNGNVVLLGDSKATTVGDLIGGETGSADAPSGFNGMLEALSLGSLLGLNLPKKLATRAENTMFYSLCYGTEGTDYTANDESLTLTGTREPTTIRALTSESNALIEGLEVEAMLGVNAESTAMMKYLAYGPEDHYDVVDGKIVMKNDPATNKPYAKKTVQDLLGDDLIEGIKIGDLISDVGDSGLLFAIKDWKIEDFKDTAKIDTLKIGDLLGDSGDSALMQALSGKTIGDLKKQETIESLTLSEILGDDADSSLMRALSDKTIGDLKKQETFERLKLGDLLDTEAPDTAPLIKAMKDWSIGDLSDQSRIERLKIGDLFDGGDSALMQTMQNWRIGDLSDQNKMNSLTLNDVIDNSDATGLIAAIGDIPLGDIAQEIPKLPISDVFSEEDLDNPILKHLSNSSLDSLSEDIRKLTLGQIFGDEIYSYMEITQKDGARWGYNEMRRAYYTHHLESSDMALGESNRPTDAKPQSIITYRVLKSTQERLTAKYCTFDGEIYTPYEGTDGTGTHCFVKKRIALTDPTYGFGKYLGKGNVTPLESGAKENTVIVGGTTYEVQQAENGDYYYLDGTTRVELERYVTRYESTNGSFDVTYASVQGGNININAGSVTLNGEQVKLRHDGDGFYITQTIELTLRYFDADGASYAADDMEQTEERYETADGKQYDRYLSGIWYLLLIDHGDKHDTWGETDPVYNTNATLFGSDGGSGLGGLVTGLSTSIQNFTLAELWFCGLLQSAPYGDIPKTFRTEGGPENLIDLTISKLITLVGDISNNPLWSMF